MIDTVIFDIGGVLVSGRGRRMNINEHYGLPWNDTEDKVWQEYKTGKCTEQEYWERLLKGTYMQGKEKEVALYARQVHSSLDKGRANFLLPKLKPNYNLAILSNHSIEWTDGIIKRLEFDKYCSPIIISAKVGLAKPNRAIYELILKELNRAENPEKCVFIDDDIRNIKAAEEVGIKGVHLAKEDTSEILEEKLRKLGVEV